MPTLNWIGKDAVVRHHKDVPFRLLEPVPELSCGDPASGNLIVQGDNLHALKALLPRYAGQVKCIYIDPPYNTGNEGWVYNDNVNSPEIRKWLGEVVGKEGETLDRHDRWLCMMYPRLRLLREFLSDDGVIFISINDVSSSYLELLADEIFGRKNFIARLIWNTEGNTDNQLEIKVNHEYVLMYVKDASQKVDAIGRVVDPNTREDSNLWKGIADNNINKNSPANPPAIFTIPVGFPSSETELFYPAKKVDDEFFRIAEKDGFISDALKAKYDIENLSGLPVKLDDLIVKNGVVERPCRVYGGFANRKKLEKFVAGGLKPIPDDGGPLKFYVNRNSGIRYRREVDAPSNILSVLRSVGTTERTRTMLRNMGVNFSYPKPVELVKYLLSFGAQPEDSLVMDCFAGSGTTGESVLRLNQEDGGRRKFLLVEMDESVFGSVTTKRMRSVCSGYADSDGSNIPGVGSSFQAARLSKDTLFGSDGQVRCDVKFSQLAEFVWFRETGTGYIGDSTSPLLGVHDGRAIYLLFNGILKDKSIGGGNVLTAAVYESLPAHDGPKVIYAAACRLGKSRLQRDGIVFKQTPYALEV